MMTGCICIPVSPAIEGPYKEGSVQLEAIKSGPTIHIRKGTSSNKYVVPIVSVYREGTFDKVCSRTGKTTSQL